MLLHGCRDILRKNNDVSTRINLFFCPARPIAAFLIYRDSTLITHIRVYHLQPANVYTEPSVHLLLVLRQQDRIRTFALLLLPHHDVFQACPLRRTVCSGPLEVDGLNWVGAILFLLFASFKMPSSSSHVLTSTAVHQVISMKP